MHRSWTGEERKRRDGEKRRDGAQVGKLGGRLPFLPSVPQVPMACAYGTPGTGQALGTAG